jgi:hypothetical protein
MKILIIILLCCIVISACEHNTSNKTNDKGDRLFVTLKDSTLINLIDNYISNADYERNIGYLSVEIHTIGEREIFYITHEKRFYIEREDRPCYLSKVRNEAIFIYSNANKYVNQEYDDFFKDVLVKFQIGTKPDFNDLYHPDVWKLTKCGSNLESLETKVLSYLEDDYVSCP